MPHARFASLLLWFSLLPQGGASAQSSVGEQVVEAGEHARVEILADWEIPPEPTWVVGRVVRATSDSLWLHVSDTAAPFAFTPASYTRLQVKVPRTTGQGSARGLWIGALIGAGVVAILATPISGGDENIPAGSFTAIGAVAGAVLGAPIGAIVGAARPGGRWVPASLP